MINITYTKAIYSTINNICTLSHISYFHIHYMGIHIVIYTYSSLSLILYFAQRDVILCTAYTHLFIIQYIDAGICFNRICIFVGGIGWQGREKGLTSFTCGLLGLFRVYDVPGVFTVLSDATGFPTGH